MCMRTMYKYVLYIVSPNIYHDDDDEVLLNVLRCQLTY